MTTMNLNNTLGIYEYFNDTFLRIKGTNEQLWFSGKDVATILGYKDTCQAIRKNVETDDKMILNGCLPDLYSKPSENAIYINESGLYSLILKSKKQEAKAFKKWVTSVVLPSIRKTGSYTIPQNTRTTQEIALGVIEKGINILKSIDMFDDRDRINFADLTKSAVGTSSLSVSVSQEDDKQNEEWSVSRRLSEFFGITNSKEHDLCTSFGRQLAKCYRINYESEPLKRKQYVKGTIRPVNSYNLDFWEKYGDDLMRDYFYIDSSESD